MKSRKSRFMSGIGGLALALSASSAAAAGEYCAMPFLYATNVRPACEQYGAEGMAGLYQSSLFIHGLLEAAAVQKAATATAFPDSTGMPKYRS